MTLVATSPELILTAIATAIAHDSWINYMDHPSKGVTGAVILTMLFSAHRSLANA